MLRARPDSSRTYTSLAAFFILLAAVAVPETVIAQEGGLTPENRDGFETGDWRNFRPHYVGTSNAFIRPGFAVDSARPIDGTYSLKWRGDESEHQWLMLSNAFWLARPLRYSVDFRVGRDADDWAAGIYLLESVSRFTGLRVTRSVAAFREDGAGWGEGGDLPDSDDNRPLGLQADRVYRLVLELDERNRARANVREVESGELLAEMNGRTAVDPQAISIYVETGAGSETRLWFDNVRVDSGEYRIPAGEWVRSPHFVVLPRLPDLPQEEGNWVGAQSVIKGDDGLYRMWYRIRNNERRGAGYGYAWSEDGLNWQRHADNPVLRADERYASNEKITVLEVDGIYKAWYTVDTGERWITVLATSDDGINWRNEGPVIEDLYNKDADVIYVDGTYYLYAIGPQSTDISVFTSQDGRQWTLRATYEQGTHRHLAVYYDRTRGQFSLYPSGGRQGVSVARSEDGIHFGELRPIWHPPAVGLDDWPEAGITYLSFMRNGHGQIDDESALPVYYQARNSYNNNIPGWLYHGGERVVLAGRFEGVYPGVWTRIRLDGLYEYEAFPFEIGRAVGLEIYSVTPLRFRLESWTPDEEQVAVGRIEYEAELPEGDFYFHSQPNSHVQWSLGGLAPETRYRVQLESGESRSGRTDAEGNLLLSLLIGDGTRTAFEIIRE